MSLSSVLKSAGQAASGKVGQKVAIAALLASAVGVVYEDNKAFQSNLWKQAFEHADKAGEERKAGMEQMRQAHKEDSTEIKQAVKECTQAINRQTELILSGRTTSKRPAEAAPLPHRGDGY